MSEKYTIKDVTKDLGYMLTLTKIFELDDDGFWSDTGTKKRFAYRLENTDEPKDIVAFQDPLPRGNHYFFNPFSEGLGRKSPADQLFYKTIRVSFNLNLQTAMLYVLKTILESKTNGTSPGHIVTRMSSVPVDKKSTVFDVVDDKIVTEFERIMERAGDSIIFVPYLHKQMTAKVKCDALSDSSNEWDEKYGKDIRKKSLLVFKSILMGVLGIKTPAEIEDFSVKYDPTLKSASRLHATLSVYLNLYSKFNDILPDAFATDGEPSDSDAIDLGLIQEVIDRMPMAYAIAKHMVQPALPRASVTDTSPADTGGLRFDNQGNKRKFKRPDEIDNFGRDTGRRFGNSAVDEKHGRFSNPSLSEVAVDPFSPVTRRNFDSGTSFNQMGRSWSSPSNYFGGGGMSSSMSFDSRPPSNFGSPSTPRRYF